MPTPEWYRPTNEGLSPFDISYPEEFELPPERTGRELKSLGSIISIMPRKPRTLDIAGGFERIGSELVRRNLVESLVDLDLNKEFLQMARGNQITKVVQGDMRNLGFRDESFDLALIMFTSFGYFDDEDNFGVLQEAHRVLSRGGILILDLPNYNRISRDFSATREMQLENGDSIKYRKRIEGEYLIEKRCRIKRNGEKEELLPIKLRIYSSEEIMELCQCVGFSEVKISDQDLRGFDPHNSRRLWITSTK